MDLEKQASLLNKKIEKITRILTDGTALTPTQWQAKEAERSALAGQLLACQANYPPKIRLLKGDGEGGRVKPYSGLIWMECSMKCSTWINDGKGLTVSYPRLGTTAQEMFGSIELK